MFSLFSVPLARGLGPAGEPVSPLSWLRSWTAERRRQRLRRDAFNTLLNVDDNVLDDVTGLTRGQVEHASRLPLSVDAIEHVRRIQDF